MAGALDAALALASQGFPVFPCGRNKRPAIKDGHGFHDASTDPETIRNLFGAAGDLVGTPTGEITGFDVLDLDYRNGALEWEHENEYRLPETRIHQTQSGGRHYLFKHAPGVRNNASKVAPGIDVRGDGGYIIAPPSEGYSVVSDAEIVEWPDWLLDLVLSKPPDLTKLNGHHPAGPIESRRLAAFVRSVADRVRVAGEGGKHFALRNAALALGGVMVAAGLSENEASQLLLHALPANVKDWQNAAKTVAWGLSRGRERPIELDDRPEYTARRPNIEPSEPPPYEPMGDRPADSRETPNPDVIPFSTFSEVQDVAELEDFVEDLLVMGAMSIIYGKSNCGKSFFVLDLAMRVSAGHQWREQAVERGAVLYLALEGGKQAIRNRLLAIRQQEGWDGYDLPFAFISVPIDLRNPNAHVEPLIATVNAVAARFAAAECPVRWIIVDTLNRAMAGGNENASEDMGALVINCDRLRAATLCHLTLVHHTGKDEARGARGHSSAGAATDTEIEIVDGEGTRTVTVTKQRDLPTLEPFAFKLRQVEIGTNRRGKPITTCVVEYEGTPAERRGKVTGASQAARAVEILTDLCAQSGAPGYGLPADVRSVPEHWWRDRFFERAMPGEKDDTKSKAFRRVSAQLIGSHQVGMLQNRVWIVQLNSTVGSE